jgi:glutathione S-transferase
MSAFTLVVGNKNYSSWSLRGFLAARAAGVAFDEALVRLSEPGSKDELLKHSPAGKVPVLKHGDRVIWDSLAIIEYLAEVRPQAGLWPADPGARAHARSVAAEMHAGFGALRAAMPMNLRKSLPGKGRGRDVAEDIERICHDLGRLPGNLRRRRRLPVRRLLRRRRHVHAGCDPFSHLRGRARRAMPGLCRCGPRAPRFPGMARRRARGAMGDRGGRGGLSRPPPT